MQQVIREFVITLRGMWRYRRLGLATAWLVAALGAGFVMTIPDRYEASARVFVNTDSILKPLMAGMTVEPNIGQRVSMLSRVVVSRPNVEKLMGLVGIESQSMTPADYEHTVDQLSKTLLITATGRDNVYTLSYRDRNPDRAKRMVEHFTSLFVEMVRGNKTSDADVAKKFIDEQIEIYEKKLQEAEARLKDFRLRNMVMNPGADRDYFTRMHEASALLSQAELQLREAENSRSALRDQLAREMALEERRNAVDAEAVPGASDSVPEIDARIDAMQRTLDVLLQKYTDQHPDVIGTRRVIRELAEQRRQLLAARKKEGVPAVVALAPARGPNAYEQLKVSLAQAEANVASLRTRVAEYTERYNRLKQAATAVPQLDAEFAQLNRDYDVNKKNYESLLARRESATLSSDMQAVAGVGDFHVVDPPHVSPRPVAPNRLLLLPLALLMALGAGVAATFIAIQMRPTFYDGKTLRAVTSLPVLGAISMLPSRARGRAKIGRAVGFLVSLGALVGAYAAGFVALMLATVRV